MEELIDYLRKTFDESTLKIINFMQNANLLVSEMKVETINEGDKTVTKTSPNIIETSYLRLCDDDPEFSHNMMGEVFLHYLEYILRDVRANWRLDINRLKQDLASRCSYCNIALKYCPMKVLAYVKKCARDENINETALFEKLMNVPDRYVLNEIEEENVADKILYLCKTPIDLKGAEFLIDTDSIKIEKEEYGKITYKTLDFEVKNVSLINNLYSYFVENNGITGSLDIADLKISDNFSYMFDKSVVELAVYIKYLCESHKVNYPNVFDRIYKKLGAFENIPKIAYYKEYLRKVDTMLDNNENLQNEIKDVLTYIRNYDKKIKLPYIKFDFLLYTKNSQIVDNVVSILNKYCRTYNYLSNKNILFVDTEMFIKRTKDNYDVIMQLDRLYNENDFLVFGNLDKALNINEYRLDTFLTTIPKFYNRNRRSVTILSGEKKTVEKLLEKYDILREKVFKHVIDVEAYDVELVKEKVFKRLKRIGNLSEKAKEQIENYIEKQYQKDMVNETEFIDTICDDIIYNKFKLLEDNDDIKSANLPIIEQDVKLDESLEKLNNLIGATEVKYRVKEIMKYIEYQKKIGEEKNINLNMMFKGNSGTGKTTISKLMAEILYALGITKNSKIIEVTGKDLIGEHLGQTAPKTQRIIDSALRRSTSYR